MYETNNSAAWKENQSKRLTNEAFVEVSYYISDADLEVGDATDNGVLELLSDTSQAVDVVENREIVPYATLEQDLWLLNGSKITVPDEGPDKDNEDLGYISDWLCDDKCNFDPHPTIDIRFASKVNILPGLTITWGSAHDDYPVEFKVATYNEYGEVLQSKLTNDNADVVSTVDFTMQDFHKITVEIIKWGCKFRRARVCKIFGGIKKVYEKSDLLKFTASHEVDPLSAKLPKYEVSFDLNNIDRAYDLNTPNSLTQYMMERQEIRTRYGFRTDDGSVEWIPGGLYFLSDWEVPQNGLSASFKARDLMGFLDGTYYKGLYHSEGISLYSLAEDVLEEAHLPKLKNKAPGWIVDESLKDIKTKSPLPVCSFAECLQLIANAAKSTVHFDRNGTLHISPLSPLKDGESSVDINEDNSYSKAEISLLKPLKRIYVSMYGWVESEEKEIYNSKLTLQKGENVFIIEYSDAATDVRVTEISDEFKNKITADFYSKCCKLTIKRTNDDPDECHVVLSGQTLKSTETIVSVENSDIGEIIPLKNTLITDTDRARDIGRWLRERYNNRKNISVQWRVDPSIDVTDFVTLNDKQKARIFAASFDFGGAFKGKSEGMVIEE